MTVIFQATRKGSHQISHKQDWNPIHDAGLLVAVPITAAWKGKGYVRYSVKCH